MSKIIIGRHINGITLNDYEYLLDGASGDIVEFESDESAKAFLRENGFTDDDMYYMVFREVRDRL